MSAAATTITVRITPTIERDYERRGVFPDLRLAKAAETMHQGTVGVFEVSVDTARVLLDDAKTKRFGRKTPRGTPKAYTCLAEQLRPALPESIEERARELQCYADRVADRVALKRAAELDAKAKAAEEKLRDLPATEEEFRALAKDAFWRTWGAFELVFLRPNGSLKGSGYRFSRGAREVIEGYIHSILWTLELDAVVTFDKEVRYGEVDKLRIEATKLDAPLQRFIEHTMRTMPAARCHRSGRRVRMSGVTDSPAT